MQRLKTQIGIRSENQHTIFWEENLVNLKPERGELFKVQKVCYDHYYYDV